jgi:hypothetical protein
MAVLAGCSAPAEQSAKTADDDWVVPIKVDGTALYIPRRWNKQPRSEPRPWRNGLQIDSGGWGSASPRLGPIATAEPLRNGRFYESDSATQSTQPDRHDPFFSLTVTFEFPMPPVEKDWLGRAKVQPVFPFNFDQLEISYNAPKDRVNRPYIELFKGVAPHDGVDVGHGWREVRRSYANRPIVLRFDAQHWRKSGGSLPGRVAASFDPVFWSHFTALKQERWSETFESQSLPLSEWNSRYDVAEELFTWLQTPPEKRDLTRRFVWWTDLKYRPTH